MLTAFPNEISIFDIRTGKFCLFFFLAVENSAYCVYKNTKKGIKRNGKNRIFN